MFTQGKTKALFYNYSPPYGGEAQYYASCKLILYIVIVALDFYSKVAAIGSMTNIEVLRNHY